MWKIYTHTLSRWNVDAQIPYEGVTLIRMLQRYETKFNVTILWPLFRQRFILKRGIHKLLWCRSYVWNIYMHYYAHSPLLPLPDCHSQCNSLCAHKRQNTFPYLQIIERPSSNKSESKAYNPTPTRRVMVKTRLAIDSWLSMLLEWRWKQLLHPSNPAKQSYLCEYM